MTLFQFGSFEFLEHIELDSYVIIPNARLDMDSYTDANGVLHREALEHTKTKITFSLLELSQSQMAEVMNGLTSNYIDFKQRDATCTYFDPETNSVKTGHFYLSSNLELRIKEVRKGEFIYSPTELVFVEY